MSRGLWSDYFFGIAEKVAERSTCLRRKVGAVAVDEDRRILGTGYNGAPSKYRHCTPETCIRTVKNIPSGERAELCYAIHAEQNIVLRLGEKLEGSTLFVTHQPCVICLKLLIGAKVRCVAWKNPYNDEFSLDMMSGAGLVYREPDVSYSIFVNCLIDNPERPKIVVEYSDLLLMSKSKRQNSRGML